MERAKDTLDKSVDALEEGMEEMERGMGAGSMITTALLAAAVGAGVALLYAPEEGSKTRRKLSRRLGNWQEAAASGLSEGVDYLSSNTRELRSMARRRGRQRASERRRAALMGTLAGAGLALLFAPASGSRIRSDIGRQVNNLKTDASEKYREFKRRRDTTRAVEPDANDRVVRTVEELGRESTEVF
ncbi:MAG TPA: YtxH domain-containing protein [Gemmatimonadales bacterium]|nr:YtxH domain-containing protein [Gemmatimonadales bacterium]